MNNKNGLYTDEGFALLTAQVQIIKLETQILTNQLDTRPQADVD